MFKINMKVCSLYKIWLIIFILSSACPEISSGKNFEAGIKSGVSRDVLNYEDDSEKLVIRGGTRFTLPDTFNFELTTLRNMDDKTSSYTWNLAAENLCGFMDFNCGNFNLHFGSGLMMGKQSYSSGDPFSKKISIARDQTISMSNGGNPEYSLSGIVCDLYKTYDRLKIYLIPFFSDQRRYISYESFDDGAVDSSLFTLNTKIRKSGTSTEPVNIINYGGVLGLQTLDMFNIQLYYFETDLKSDRNRDILWDRNRNYAGEGIDLIRNCGFFAEYTDRNISFFIEPAVSSIDREKTVTDFALAWGIGIQNSLTSLVLKGKNTGTDFHSEYSSGGRTPERIWEMKCGIFPLKFFETGFILYSEKNLVPSYNKNYTEGSIQEELFASIDSGTAEIDLNIKRRTYYSSDLKNFTNQGNLSAGITPSERWYLKGRTSVQKREDDLSYLAGVEVKFLFLDYFSFSFGYTRIIIDGETPFYAVVTPASEHSSISCFRESAHGGSVNLRYKKERDSFYIRFSVIKTDSGRTGEIESGIYSDLLGFHIFQQIFPVEFQECSFPDDQVLFRGVREASFR